MGTYTAETEKEYRANLPQAVRDIPVLEKPLYMRITHNLINIKATNLMRRSGMICSCVKATFGGGASIIGYIYSEVIKSPQSTVRGGVVSGQDDGWLARYLGGGTDTFEHRHVCYGPTYASQDGEFRGRFIQWNQVYRFFEEYSDICDEVEKLVIARMEAKEMSFQVDICYPDGFNARDDFEDSIDETRACIRLFIMCWIVDMYEIYFEIDANHMNPGYYAKIFTRGESFCFENILGKMYERKLYRMSISDATRITRDMKSIKSTLDPQVGQKIFTMSIMETASPWNINFPFWRELYATKKCAELTLSMLTMSHPFLVDWFYITNTHAGIFDTLASHERFAHSEQAAQIDARLRDIDEATHIDAAKSNAFVSDKFKGLSQEIWGAIHYGETYIELTNITVGLLIEHVGFTLGDLPSRIIETTYAAYRSVLNDFSAHARIQFEYLSALYLSHSKCGIIHADLHYNNCTVFEMFRNVKISGELATESGYYLNGKLYTFLHNGLFGCIIDMSRAILGINRGILIDEFGEFITDTFLRNQREYVLEIISVYFGDFIKKNRAAMERAYDSNTEAFLKITSAVDVLCVGENMLRLAREPQISSGAVQMTPRAIELAEKIVNRAREIFSGGMAKLLSGVVSRDYPALIIIEELFTEFVRADPLAYSKNTTICDIINCDGAYDKTMERGLKSWRYSDPELAIPLIHKQGVQLGKEFLELNSRENNRAAIKPKEKLGGKSIPEWMYN